MDWFSALFQVIKWLFIVLFVGLTITAIMTAAGMAGGAMSSAMQAFIDPVNGPQGYTVVVARWALGLFDVTTAGSFLSLLLGFVPLLVASGLAVVAWRLGRYFTQT